MDSIRIVENPLETEGGYGVQMFWRVFVNDQEITDHARPFEAGDPDAVLYECQHCGRCSGVDLAVAKYKSTVIWFGVGRDEDVQRWGLLVDRVYFFDMAEYATALGTGFPLELPELSDQELRRLVLRVPTVPHLKGLYTEPTIESDPLGHRLLKLVGEVFSQDNLLFLADTPPAVCSVRIGSDLDLLPECVIEVGNAASGPALRLIELPCFPIWMTGAKAIEEIVLLASEC